jgi:hypothetical protein
MRAGDVEDDEVLRARLRTRTRCSGMTKLITKSNVLKRVLVEKLTVPPLLKQSGDCFTTSDEGNANLP